ncbi:MAG: MBL fold metallo-hydrolase [Castellaniella sp.]
MNPQENALQYPWNQTLPEPGQALAVADGVRWIRMPLPFALDHINLWLLRDRIDGREGWTVIDCGIDRSEVRDCWETVFSQSLEGLPVLRVLVTHMHPDHVGLAHWLCKRWDAPLWMSMTDYALARLWAGSAVADTATEGSGPAGETAARHFARHGLVNPEAQALIRKRHDYYARLVPDVPARFHRLLHGHPIQIGGRPWHIIVGYGHAPEHVSLWCPTLDVLISGDMVLPRISTNISVFDLEPEANPLPLYLESLNAYDPLPEQTLVLPSHGRPFKGLHARIAQQQSHHADRLADVLAACAQPKSAHDLLPVLFHRQLDLHQLSFAMGESIAHLHALYFQGALIRTLDADGVYRFQRA